MSVWCMLCIEDSLSSIEAVGKRPSAALPSSLVIAAYFYVRLFLGTSEALQLDIFHQPPRSRFFDSLIDRLFSTVKMAICQN